jgi:EmrB/QacA subfamily drug resistance transporter
MSRDGRRARRHEDRRPGRAADCPPPPPDPGAGPPLRLASAPGRWILAASILGSGAAFLETTVVNVALPAIGRDLDLGIAGLQWVLDGYLLTLSALMLLGGSLGDVYRRRRIFAAGLLGFALASALVAIAPGAGWLVAFRLLQGAAGALLVPNSLALVDAAFAAEERGAAIGRWAGWSGVSTALGPLAGGWLVLAFGWRWVFAVVIPFALAAAWIVWRKVPESPTPPERPRSVDYPGAVLVTLGLAGVVAALVSGPSVGFAHPAIVAAGLGGLILLAAFLLYERRARDPLLPLSIFRSRQFTGANLTTLFVYAALSTLFFLLMLVLQDALGYSALLAGASLLPVNLLLLLLSPLAGRVGERIGPRWPMTAGALVAALGLALLTRVGPGAGYLTTLLPALAIFGLGLATFVAPLTAAVLGAVPAQTTGLASGINNAAARLAGLLAVAVLPLAAGLGGLQHLAGPALVDGYARATWISAALCVLGAATAFLTVRGGASIARAPHPSPEQGCTQRSTAPDNRPRPKG